MTQTTQTFEEFLSTRNPTPNTVLNVGRFYINERTDYLPPEEMRQQVVGAAEDNAAVTSVIQDLAHDNVAMENAALAYLSWAWDQPGQATSIRELFDTVEEQAQLPVVETIIIATVAMYGMYLLKTHGIKEKTEVIVRDERGNFRRETIKTYHSFGETLRKAWSVLRFWE